VGTRLRNRLSAGLQDGLLDLEKRVDIFEYFVTLLGVLDFSGSRDLGVAKPRHIQFSYEPLVSIFL
jgi:hypothetical protein